ncbi:MAG: ATP-binding protein [Oscillospiraceae bacterium]|nr:ATP-binding protein [Oscillospiraceae bacterium]
MFVGRERELADLNRRYESGQFEFAVIYGRRRVGKTTLINEFIKDKECILYSATETNSKQNLTELSRSIYAISEDYNSSESSFTNFQAAFETVFKIADNRRIIFVIDEYPYLADCSKGISSVLQLLIDRYHESSKLFIILCGSSMSFMENQVMGYKSPLYGRRTCQYKIRPFEFDEAKRYYSKFKGEDIATIYGITGGIPLYMSLMNDRLSVEQNIKDNFLTPNAYLYEEPTNLIKQECRDASQYNSIISAIANGASRLSEICTKTDLDTSLATSYINKLIGLGIVKKELPFGATNSRKAIYVLEDSMFIFWYKFVQNNTSVINRGFADIVYKKIEPQIMGFMGAVFEEICKQYMWQLLIQERVPIEFTDLGRWWGTDPRTRSQTEIDIIGKSDTDDYLFGECKWTNEKVDLAVLETLISRSELFNYKNKHFYLFAKKGFTKGCIEKANAMGNVTLVCYSDMIKG